MSEQRQIPFTGTNEVEEHTVQVEFELHWAQLAKKLTHGTQSPKLSLKYPAVQGQVEVTPVASYT